MTGHARQGREKMAPSRSTVSPARNKLQVRRFSSLAATHCMSEDEERTQRQQGPTLFALRDELSKQRSVERD